MFEGKYIYILGDIDENNQVFKDVLVLTKVYLSAFLFNLSDLKVFS